MSVNKPWSRPVLPVTRPKRSFTGVYRTADKHIDGQTLAGVPLQTTTDAVVAAVQLGYKVADAQIARGRRMARSLDRSARGAGMRDWIEPTDAAERLVVRATLTALEWLEQAALDPKGPARRIVRAQYDAMGTMFGLRDRDGGSGAEAAASPRVRTQSREPAAPLRPDVNVRHGPGSSRRAVRAVLMDPWNPPLIGTIDLTFHHASDVAGPPLSGKLEPGKPIVLEVSTALTHPGGVWRAAVCQGDLQVALIEIEL